MRNGWIFSFLFHLGILALWLLLPQAPEDSGVVWNASGQARPESLTVRTLSEKEFRNELKDALEETEAQVVSGDDQLKSERAGIRKGKMLLSKHNQQVDEETQSARLGKFKNNLKEGAREAGSGQSPQNDVPPAKPEIAKLFELPRSEKDLEAMAAHTRNTGRLRGPASIEPGPGDKKGEGFSSTEDYLKDVAVGANTLLNTKEFRFYGFYERIREKLSYRWRQNLDVAFKKIISERRNIGAGEQTTQVHVKMGPAGEVRSVRVIGSSGYEELDEAALVAFRQAGPFPNPPAEMLDAQKNVTIRWDFVVLGDESSGVRVQVRQRTW